MHRVSKLLTTTLAKGGDLVVSGYYDDFSQLEVEKLTASAESTLKDVFSTLGFALSTVLAKDIPSSSSFSPLGVVIDLSASKEGLW